MHQIFWHTRKSVIWLFLCSLFISTVPLKNKAIVSIIDLIGNTSIMWIENDALVLNEMKSTTSFNFVFVGIVPSSHLDNLTQQQWLTKLIELFLKYQNYPIVTRIKRKFTNWLVFEFYEVSVKDVKKDIRNLHENKVVCSYELNCLRNVILQLKPWLIA